MKVENLTKEEFLKKVVNYEGNPGEWKFLGERPCVVDFYADWCGPCKMVAPVLEQLADEYAGKVDFYKVNTEHEHQLATRFNIRSIPSLMFCPMQGPAQMAKGALGKDTLKKAIEDILLKDTTKEESLPPDA